MTFAIVIKRIELRWSLWKCVLNCYKIIKIFKIAVENFKIVIKKFKNFTEFFKLLLKCSKIDVKLYKYFKLF